VRTRYEAKIIEIEHPANTTADDRLLTRLGNDGWRIVGVIARDPRIAGRSSLILEREVVISERSLAWPAPAYTHYRVTVFNSDPENRNLGEIFISFDVPLNGPRAPLTPLPAGRYLFGCHLVNLVEEPPETDG